MILIIWRRSRDAVERWGKVDPKVAGLIRDKVIASAEVDSVREHSVVEALRQLDALDFNVGFDWLVHRLDWIGAGDRRVSYRDVPDGVIALLGERRDGHTWRAELAELVARYEKPGLSHGHRSALARSIAALAGDSPELTELIQKWAEQGEEGLERAYEVIGAPSGFDAFTERARILLRIANTRRTRAAIVSGHERSAFSGPISEHYIGRAERFRPWLENEDPLLVGLARDAIHDLEEAAKRHAEREKLEDDGYWSD